MMTTTITTKNGQTKTVVDGSFTIIHFEGGSNISFNHKTMNIRWVSATGVFYDVEWEDDEWFDLMQKYKLWRE